MPIPMIETLEQRLQFSGQGGELTGTTAVQFNTLPVGDSQNNEIMVTVTNTGTQSVQLTSPYSHDTSEVTIDDGTYPIGGFLNPGSSATFGVIANTAADLTINTLVTAPYNDGNNQFFDIPVTGTVGRGSTPDTSAPTAAVSYAKALRVSAKYYYFAVKYSDNTAVKVSSLDANDILVSRRKYPTLHAALISETPNTNAASVTAIYAVRYGSRGTWTSAYNGLWTLSLAPGQVADTSGNTAAARTLGQVAFIIPAATAARTATATARPEVASLFSTAAIPHRDTVWDA